MKEPMLESLNLAALPSLSSSELTSRADIENVPNILVPVTNDTTLLESIIQQIEEAVSSLFPAWLPGAEDITSPGGSGHAAVQTLARAEAARSDVFGPYLLAIAENALTGAFGPVVGDFASEIRLRECFKLFCRSYETDKAAIILDITHGMPSEGLVEIQQAALFIHAQNGFHVWLTGAGIEDLNRIPVHEVRRLAKRVDPPTPPVTQKPYFTPLAGRPHPWSETENRLENYLSQREWATGRMWNARWSDGVLSNPVRVDLMWQDALLVVELDGPDHLAPEKYVQDRQRDRLLQSAGFKVLRFTNEEVAADISSIASEIERVLTDSKQ